MPLTRRAALGWAVAAAAASVGARLLPDPLAASGPQDDPQFTPPPDGLSEADLVLLAAATELARHADASALVREARFFPLHPQPAFRTLVRGIARPQPLSLAGEDEPGTRIVAKGRLLDADGQPVPNAVIYAYHTSARGWYATSAAHVRAWAGDARHAQLFGYLRSDPQGGFEIRTIRPGGYPRSTLPEHIHFEAEAPGFRPRVTELLFEDDPRLDAAQRQRAEQERFVVSAPAADPDGHPVFTYTVTLDRE